MKEKLKIALFGLLFLTGSAALFVFQIYIQPTINTKEVLTLRHDVPKYHVLSDSDLLLRRVQSDGLPEGHLTQMNDVVGKKTMMALPEGMMLTPELIDVDELNPTDGQLIVPIPKNAIFAVNASLRAGDWVMVSFYRAELAGTTITPTSQVNDADHFLENVETIGLSLPNPIRVVAVRSDAGNMVKDTEQGNVNDRMTATERISQLELLVTIDEAGYLESIIKDGYQVWVSRVGDKR